MNSSGIEHVHEGKEVLFTKVAWMKTVVLDYTDETDSQNVVFIQPLRIK
jgi:hypothetical protein